ncbi:hypothetical protein [Sulfurovum mangrovi]|uniref:hypothetical protein n=1 Tax=Sulfurovum mangrovi TaxID=2893889 RepID=UPI001E3D2847|nr:hypothetical protein [Sulfurovum mangrovi]UFH60504.1 hypothetical protein LN246_06505 [Sulfurovum mangrovi]
MLNSLDRLKALSSKLEEKNREKQSSADVMAESSESIKKLLEKKELQQSAQIISGDSVRRENIKRVKELYTMLGISEKSPDFDKIFIYKAMNLSGIGLKEEDFGEVREGKYIQIIAITYEPDKNGKKKAKNISLGYFGKADALEPERKNHIIEFVLRWRYEKAFQNLEHYKDLIAKVKSPDTLF